MTIKEQPLINAVSKMGPIATPSHPVLSGTFTTLMIGLLGAFAAFFQAFGRGVAELADLVDPVRFGFAIGLLVAVGSYVVLLLASWFGRDHETPLLFVVSGFAMIAVCVAVDYAFADFLRDWLADKGSLIGSDPRL